MMLNSYDKIQKYIQKGCPHDLLLPIAGVESIMTYRSQTFKVNPLYRVIYNCCIDVLSKDKSSLTKALLIQRIGKKECEKLNQYDFNELIVEMVGNFRRQVTKSSYQSIHMEIRTSERFKLVREVFHSKVEYINSLNLVPLSFRISEDAVKEIHGLKRSKLGEVIELSIALFVIDADDMVYNFIVEALSSL